jgi:uncharacterized protein
VTKSLLMAALAAAATLGAQTPEVAGDWQGTLNTPGGGLRLVVHIGKTDDGHFKASLDSPDQGVKGIPVSTIALTGNKLSFRSAAVGGSYEGTVNQDGATIEGTWTQGTGLPLNLKRFVAAAARRPQNPIKPYPYREEDVTYANQAAGIRLAATLTIPQGKGPFPAVALITGSGPQDRDETVMEHKPFLVWADYLTRHGIAVLRTDDRGIAKSGGVFATATTADFATDTEAAVAYLKTRSEVDPHKIGLIGHSEGGTIAPMVAARNQDIAFIVLLAGTAVPGDQIIVAQVVAGAEAAGMSHEMAAQAGAKERKLLDLVIQEKDAAALKEKLRDELGAAMPQAQFETTYRQLTSPWYRYFLAYDPATALRKVTCPVLALNGDKDTQVPAKQNVPAIRKALEEGGNRHFEVVELPGLNHLFQHAKTGALAEYAQIEETVSPEMLKKVAGWILKQ